jgi:U3 small nucleolar RNA-associated protein 13
LNVCIKTFDEHTDKVWAMATTNKENRLATGGADSTILIWKDVTEEEQEEERKKQETFQLQEQELLNLLLQKRFAKALGLAIVLDQPFRALNIIKQMILEPNGTVDLTVTLKKMRDDQIDSLIKFATTWNMNGRHSWPAQLILKHVMERYTADELLLIPNVRHNIQALLPYTERHFQRLTRALQQATFVDYTWCCMKLATKVKITDDGESEQQDSSKTLKDEKVVAPSIVQSLWDLASEDSEEDIVLDVRTNDRPRQVKVGGTEGQSSRSDTRTSAMALDGSEEESSSTE